MEEKPCLERMTLEFSQRGNCLVNRDDSESLIIEVESSIGIDRDEGDCFFVLKTEKWSIDDEKDLKELFDRIKKCIKINV